MIDIELEYENEYMINSLCKTNLSAIYSYQSLIIAIASVTDTSNEMSAFCAVFR